MTFPDIVQSELDYLDSNWNTNNYSPKPTLIDGDEMRLYSGGRARSVDVANTNVITVDSAPTTTSEIIGSEYDLKVRAGVTVSIEGYHQDGGGQIADKDDFDSLRAEAYRAGFEAERKTPSGLSGYSHLEVPDINDLSPESPVDANYFRVEYDVIFVGFETLP